MKNISPSRLRKIRIWAPGESLAEIQPYNEPHQKASLIDLASNDYLALSRHPQLVKAALNSISTEGVGAGASRLITGTREIHCKLEESLAEWIGKKRVFLFPSGFQANLAAVIALANRHTTIIADKLIHHSLLIGIKASGAKLCRYSHNDLNDLERLLKASKKKNCQNILVITESLFSMEGSSANIKEIARISSKYKAKIIVDEAHALGVMGPQGKGLSHSIADQISIISGTFGKAFGSGGAFLACDNKIGESLLQSSGAFRYTTALAPSLAAAALEALNLIKGNPYWGESIQKEAKEWRDKIESNGWIRPLGNGPILSLIVGSDEKALDLESHFENSGLATCAIRPPTIPEGTSRLRIVIRRGLPKGTLKKVINALNEKK